MLRYVVKRLLLLIPVLLSVAILIFTIMYFVPGDPAQIKLGPTATADEIADMREIMGLDRPYLVRLSEYLSDVFIHFDFGTSLISNTPIKATILERLPRTLLINLVSIFFGSIVGTALGIFAALKQNKWGDTVSMIIALVGVSMPGFWFALMLILLFSVKLNWLPSFGIGGIKYYILPWIAASMNMIAILARQARSSMLEVIRSDYIKTARAKGVSRRAVIMKHALPNAMIPILTVIGSSLGTAVGGNLIVESVFSIPGLGLFMINSINNRDYPGIQASVLFTSMCVTVMMLLVDLMYAAIDPRIRASFASGKKR